MGLDAVEIVLEIEEAFDIRIPDEVAEKIQTVGQLYDCVVQQTCERANRPAQEIPDRTDLCLTAATFYLARRELCAKFGLARRQVRPRTALDDLLPRAARRREWSAMGRKLGLKLPALQRPRWVVAVATALCLASSVAAPLYVDEPLRYVVAPLWLAASGLLACLFTMPLANRFPLACATMGGLCYSLLALNYRRLIEQFQRINPGDVFQVIKAILVEQLNVDPAMVTKDASLVGDLGME